MDSLGILTLGSITMCMLGIAVIWFRHQCTKRINHLHDTIFNLRETNQLCNERLEPHFLHNSISTIQYYITSDNKRDAIKGLKLLSNYLRRVRLYNRQSISLHEMMDFVQSYLALQNLRHGVTCIPRISVHPPQDLDMVSITLPETQRILSEVRAKQHQHEFLIRHDQGSATLNISQQTIGPIVD